MAFSSDEESGYDEANPCIAEIEEQWAHREVLKKINNVYGECVVCGDYRL